MTHLSLLLLFVQPFLHRQIRWARMQAFLFFWLHLTWRHTVIHLPQQRQDNWTLISVSNLPLLLSALLVEIKGCYIAGEERMTDSKPMWIIKLWELFFLPIWSSARFYLHFIYYSPLDLFLGNIASHSTFTLMTARSMFHWDVPAVTAVTL